MAARDSRGRGGVRLWARVERRRRWPSLVVLGLLAGLSAGLAVASFVGSQRTDDAFARLRRATHSSDAVVFPSQVGDPHPDWTKLEARPYVARIARWNLIGGTVDGEPGGLLFGPSDGVWMQEVDRPVVVDGRMFDTDRADEVVVTEALRTRYGVGVGTSIRYRFYKDDASFEAGGPPDGMTMTMHVVGVIRFTGSFLFSDELPIPSPALMRDFGSRIEHHENAMVQLRDPDEDMATLKREVAGLVAPGVPVLDLHQVERRVGTATDLERTALLLLAGAVAIAGLVFVGQALSRSVRIPDGDLEVLRAVGFARRDLALAALLPMLLVGAVAAITTFATAVALSGRFPIGYAAQIDPDRGIHVSPWITLPGAVLAGLLVVGGAAVLGWVFAARRGPQRATSSRFGARVRRLRPVAVALGAGMVVEPGRGRRNVPVRPALLGAIVGVLGLAGTLTLARGLDDALARPESVGVTWDAQFTDVTEAMVDPASRDFLRASYVRRIETSPDVAGVAVLWRVVLDADHVGVPTFAVEPKQGDIGFVTVAGRGVLGPDDVVLGPATARLLGKHIGDTVTVGGRRLRLVGEALFPAEVHSGFDEGMLLPLPTLLAVSPVQLDGDGGPSPLFVVTWKAGVDPRGAPARLSARVHDPGTGIEPAAIPPELSNLRNVRSVPKVLVGFLAALGVSTLAHALVVSVRRRRHDFAVLRAVGCTRRTIAGVVLWQSLAVTALGLLVGIPLGIAGGRLGWAWVAHRVPLVLVPPVAPAIGLVVPGTIAVAALVAAWPSRRAGRLQPAQVLRAE